MIIRDLSVVREIDMSGEPRRNEFCLGDISELMPSLREKYKGQVSLVYLDPPFRTGERFFSHVRVGEAEWRSGKGETSLTAYNDDMPAADYMQLMRDVLIGAREMLTDSGMLFLHIDWRMHPYLRLLGDEIFGSERFLNEIIWAYRSGGRSKKYFPRKHDVILMYSKTRDYDFHIADVAEVVPGGRDNNMKREIDADGRSYRTIRSNGRVYTYYDDEPVAPGDVWTDVSHLQQKDPQRTGYDTQKPLKLLERIIKCASREGDIVADFFVGSGTTAEAAHTLNRRFVVADKSPLALQTTRRRLKGAGCTYNVSGFEGEPYAFAEASDMGMAQKSVSLLEFTLEEGLWERDLQGLDAVDSWAAGYIRNGEFIACDSEIRSRKTPSLKGHLCVPLFEGDLAVRVSDILGRDFYYRIECR